MEGILDGTSHDGAISSRADTIRDKGWDILETATDQEPASTQLQKGITIQKDGPIEDVDWNEGATIASNEEYRRDDTMKSVKSPSNQWRDPHGTVEKENVERVIASLDVKDNTVSETGVITVIQERVSDNGQGEL